MPDRKIEQRISTKIFLTSICKTDICLIYRLIYISEKTLRKLFRNTARVGGGGGKYMLTVKCKDLINESQQD